MSNADKRTEIALFRYTLILPLLRGQYPPGGKQQLRRRIAAQVESSSQRRPSASSGLKPTSDAAASLM